MTDQPDLRQRIASAIHRYDNHLGLSGNDMPSQHHYGEADAVMAVVQPELATLRVLVADFVDSDPCWYDHHGYCQAHGWFATDPACPHARAKALGIDPDQEQQ